MEDHAQKMTATWLCLLPRLIPAPQGLLKSVRPKPLPPVPGIQVVGAFSGTKVEELNFAANLIHEIEQLEPLEFREYFITPRYDLHGRTDARLEVEDGLHKADANPGRYEKTRGRYLNSHGRHEMSEKLKARLVSPENALTVSSCLITIGLFAWSLILQDGVAALSLICMSLASTLTGLAFWWTPKVATRPSSAIVPKSVLVLKTRGGAFVVVHCTEEIARELYIGSDEVSYHFSNRSSRVFVGFGTLFLMVAVVLLGNCNWTMQAAIGVTYLVLNGAYWLVSLLPEKLCWHMSAYKVVAGNLPYHMANAREDTDVAGLGVRRSFTRTLWYAIQRSKSGSWIKAMEAAPQTEAWDRWVEEAVKNSGDEDWPVVSRKDDLINGSSKGGAGDGSLYKAQGEKMGARVDSTAATTALDEVVNDTAGLRPATVVAARDLQQNPGALSTTRTTTPPPLQGVSSLLRKTMRTGHDDRVSE